MSTKLGQVQFEVEFTREGGLDQYHVHIRCFAAWEFERGKVRADAE